MVLPLPTSPFKQAVHRHGAFEVGGNFAEDALLRRGGLKGEDALDGVADQRVAHPESDTRLPPSLLPAQGQAQLIKEKILEDEPPVSGRAELVERFERHIGRRKMHEAQGVAARWKPVALQHGGRQWIGGRGH